MQQKLIKIYRDVLGYRYSKLLLAGFGVVLFAGIGTALLASSHADTVTPSVVPLATTTPSCNDAMATTSPSQPTDCFNSIVANFNSSNQQITKFDVAGNGIDAHDGDLAYFNGTYYLYGTSYNCGYSLAVKGTPFCGFKSYSSTDLVHWKNGGFLYDATTPAWQASCAPPRYGCYRPHVLFNAATKKYVLWINSYDNSTGYHVFTSSNPATGFVEQTQPTQPGLDAGGTAAAGYVNGDFDLFQDDDGSAYITYTARLQASSGNALPTHIIKIQKLTTDYLNAMGTAVTADATGNVEAPSLFKRNSTYYLVYGPGCAYCGRTPTFYQIAATLMPGTDGVNPWDGTRRTINATSCGGQPSFVSTVSGTNGTTYVYGSDLWSQDNSGKYRRNQALANYFWTPLSFSDTAIQPFDCQQNVTIALPGTQPSQPAGTNGIDQTSGSTNFRQWTDIHAGWSRAQSFVAGKSGKLTQLSITSFKLDNPNGSLTYNIYRAAPNGTPTGASLYTRSYVASLIGESPGGVAVAPNIAVTAGTSYVVVLSSTSTIGSYGWEYSDANPYTKGTELYLRAGANWVVETGRDLQFTTTIQ